MNYNVAAKVKCIAGTSLYTTDIQNVVIDWITLGTGPDKMGQPYYISLGHEYCLFVNSWTRGWFAVLSHRYQECFQAKIFWVICHWSLSKGFSVC